MMEGYCSEEQKQEKMVSGHDALADTVQWLPRGTTVQDTLSDLGLKIEIARNKQMGMHRARAT